MLIPGTPIVTRSAVVGLSCLNVEGGVYNFDLSDYEFEHGGEKLVLGKVKGCIKGTYFTDLFGNKNSSGGVEFGHRFAENVPLSWIETFPLSMVVDLSGEIRQLKRRLRRSKVMCPGLPRSKSDRMPTDPSFFKVGENGYKMLKTRKAEGDEVPNLILSLLEDEGPGRMDSLHYPVIDIDFPCKLVPSQTDGHYHLYLHKAVSWCDYIGILQALAKAGIIERGYALASLSQGWTAVRTPFGSEEILRKLAEHIRDNPNGYFDVFSFLGEGIDEENVDTYCENISPPGEPF
jgi:hypothetical protein